MPASMIVLIAMTVVVAILAVYRWIVTHEEGDFVHIADPSGQLTRNEQKVTRTLNWVDHAGIGLTIVTALYGIALFAIVLFGGAPK